MAGIRSPSTAGPPRRAPRPADPERHPRARTRCSGWRSSLCPAVAVTTTVWNGIILGVAVLLVQVLSSVTVALAQRLHPPARAHPGLHDHHRGVGERHRHDARGVHARALRAGRALREADRGLRHHHLAARDVRLAPAARAVVLRRPGHGPRLPVRAAGDRRVPRAARRRLDPRHPRSLPQQAAALLRAAGRRVLLDRAADGAVQRRSSAGHGGARRSARRGGRATVPSGALARLAALARAAARCSPAAARGPRRRAIAARARPRARSRAASQLAAPLARRDAGELPLDRRRRRPTCRSPIARGATAEGGGCYLLALGGASTRRGRYRLEIADPPLRRDVRPAAWALLLDIVLSLGAHQQLRVHPLPGPVHLLRRLEASATPRSAWASPSRW